MPGSKPPGKRDRFEAWLAKHQPLRIDEAAWQRLRQDLAPLGDDALRALARESGLPLAPMVDGVRQHSFDELAASLIALQTEYESATGNAARQKAVRQLVIQAKDRARWASRRAKDPLARALKEKMFRWMLVWLENPPVFETWVRAVQQAERGSQATV